MYEEDEVPTVEEVAATRAKHRRFNSSAGFIYHYQKPTKTEIILTCIHKKEENGKCGAIIRQNIQTRVYRRYLGKSGLNVLMHHNHPPEIVTQRRVEAVNAVKTAVRNSSSRDTGREHFNRVRSQFSDIPMLYNSGMRQLCYRATGSPAVPKDIEDAYNLLMLPENERYRLTMDKEVFFKGRVTTEDGEATAFLFLSPTLMRAMGSANILHADGTFRPVTIKILYQLYTLHLNLFEKCFPFAFVLMSAKNGELYTLVIQKILKILKDEYPEVKINITTIMSDYEVAIRSSLSEAFSANSVGCYFHYGQCIWRRVQFHKLTCAYRTSVTVHNYVRELIALALLPANYILQGLQNIESHYEKDLLLEEKTVKENMDKLNKYYYDEWIRKVKPAGFSVFDQADRTNNKVENWNGGFNRHCRHAHLKFWTLVDAMIYSENEAALDYKAIASMGEKAASQRHQKDIQRDADIKENGEIFMKDEDIRKFLETSRRFMQPDKDFIGFSGQGSGNVDGKNKRKAVQPRKRFLAGTPRPDRLAKNRAKTTNIDKEKIREEEEEEDDDGTNLLSAMLNVNKKARAEFYGNDHEVSPNLSTLSENPKKTDDLNAPPLNKSLSPSISHTDSIQETSHYGQSGSLSLSDGEDFDDFDPGTVFLQSSPKQDSSEDTEIAVMQDPVHIEILYVDNNNDFEPSEIGDEMEDVNEEEYCSEAYMEEDDVKEITQNDVKEKGCTPIELKEVVNEIKIEMEKEIPTEIPPAQSQPIKVTADNSKDEKPDTEKSELKKPIIIRRSQFYEMQADIPTGAVSHTSTHSASLESTDDSQLSSRDSSLHFSLSVEQLSTEPVDYVLNSKETFKVKEEHSFVLSDPLDSSQKFKTLIDNTNKPEILKNNPSQSTIEQPRAGCSTSNTIEPEIPKNNQSKSTIEQPEAGCSTPTADTQLELSAKIRSMLVAARDQESRIMLPKTRAAERLSLEQINKIPSELTTSEMNSASHLLRTKLGPVNGLMNCEFGSISDYDCLSYAAGYPSALSDKFLQFIHIPGHWILASAGFINTVHGVAVFDSSQSKSVHPMAQANIASLLNSGNNQFQITVMPSQKQTKRSNNCGVFAIAWAVELLYGENPSLCLFDEPLMRPHLRTCFLKKEFTPFPKRKNSPQDTSPIKLSFSERPLESGIFNMNVRVYCSCRRPEMIHPTKKEDMVECDSCTIWYHQTCAKVPKKVFKNDNVPWMCRLCKQIQRTQGAKKRGEK